VTAGLSATHTKTGRLQRELLDRLRVHERDGTLPTSNRFLFYELVQAGVVSKHATGKRRPDQDTCCPALKMSMRASLSVRTNSR
jgi:hypothetical protein